MSADKGGALVRSPPGVVDTYSSHVGTSSTWGDQSTPHITALKQQQQQHSKKNASVTKILSGGYKGTSNNNAKQLIDDKTESFISLKEDEEEQECFCGGWSKARQMEYDLEQLQNTHDEILKGLHTQMDDMKQKNRDLTFQLLMGPFAKSAQGDVSSSSERKITPPQTSDKITHFEEKSEVIQAKGHENQKPTLKEIPNDIVSERTNFTANLRNLKTKYGDTEQAKSHDLEMLEEESETLRKQLIEERAKNKYLINLAEDLKRQIREETGAWCPPPPISKMVGQRQSHKLGYNGRNQYANEVLTSGSSFRLPQIPYHEQRTHSSHEQILQKNDIDVPLQNSNFKKDRLKHERNKEFGAAKALPSISSSGDPNLKLSVPLNSNDLVGNISKSEERPLAGGTYQPKNKTQTSSPHSNCMHSDNGQLPSHNHIFLKNRDLRYESKSHHQNHQPSSKDQEKGKKQRHYQEVPLVSEPNRSQSQETHQSESTRSSSKSKYPSRRKTKGEDKDLLATNNVTHYRSHSKSKKQAHKDVDFITSQNQQKVPTNITETPNSGDTKSSFDSISDMLLPSSSGSVGSVASTSSKNKHRGKNYKRGGKKSKKDSTEIRKEYQ